MKNKYSVRYAHENCHPETCCHEADWMLCEGVCCVECFDRHEDAINECDKLNSGVGEDVDVKKDWDGIGLPPVGCECELAHSVAVCFEGRGVLKDVSEGTPVEMNGSADFGHGEVRVFSGYTNGEWFNGYHRATAFRPIRTPEQRQRDEVVRKAAHALEMKNGSPISLYIKYCEDLYDAGLLVVGSEGGIDDNS